MGCLNKEPSSHRNEVVSRNSSFGTDELCGKRTLVGRPLITMKPPFRTLPACIGIVVEAPESAVSNCSTSSSSVMVKWNDRGLNEFWSPVLRRVCWCASPLSLKPKTRFSIHFKHRFGLDFFYRSSSRLNPAGLTYGAHEFYTQPNPVANPN